LAFVDQISLTLSLAAGAEFTGSLNELRPNSETNIIENDIIATLRGRLSG
jgi:hypothetical protein